MFLSPGFFTLETRNMRGRWVWAAVCQGAGALTLWPLTFTCFLFIFLGLYPKQTEVPRLGVQSEQQQRPAYTTATPTPDLSHVCHLY